MVLCSAYGMRCNLAEKRQFAVIESRQMDHLAVFHDVARALTQALELEDILRIIMDGINGVICSTRSVGPC